MGGMLKSSTNDVTKRVQLSPYSRSKMETASEAIPNASCQVNVRIMVIMMRCCSTYPQPVTSLAGRQERILAGKVNVGHFLRERISMNYVLMNHLMAKKNVSQFRYNLVIKFRLMIMVLTCSLTARITNSQ